MEQAKRYRAKVANVDANGARWEQGDIREVSSAEAAVLSHHWEAMAPAKDGSDDPELKKKLAEQDKLDVLRDQRKRKSYDEVRPPMAGGPAVANPLKSGEEKMRAMKDRKAEEKANEDRRNKGESGQRPVVVQGDRVVVAPAIARPFKAGEKPVAAKPAVPAAKPAFPVAQAKKPLFPARPSAIQKR